MRKLRRSRGRYSPTMPLSRAAGLLFALSCLVLSRNVSGVITTTRRNDDVRESSKRRLRETARSASLSELLKQKKSVEFSHRKFSGRSLLQDPDGGVHVLITYRGKRGRQHIQSNFTVEGYPFDDIHTLSGVMPMESLELLASDPDILEITEDVIVRQSSIGEAVPYGIEMSQFMPPAPYHSASGSASCDDPDTFKIAVCDSGIDVDHPDLPCRNGNGANCIGDSFGLSSKEAWDHTENSHGKHIMLSYIEFQTFFSMTD